jgi:hypothetical protein
MDWLYTTLSALAFVGVGVGLAARPGVRAWAASTDGRSWTRRVGVLGLLVVGAATGVFPSSPRDGVLLYFAAGVLAFASACLAAAGAAGATERRKPGSFGRIVRTFWRSTATEFRVTRYGLAVAGVAFLLSALTGGVAVGATLNLVAAVSQGGLLAVLTGLAAVGALVPGSGRPDRSRSERDQDGVQNGNGERVQTGNEENGQNGREDRVQNGDAEGAGGEDRG